MNKIRLLRTLIFLEVLGRPGRGGFFVISALAEPMALLAGMTLLFTVLSRGMSFGDNLVVFLATGLIPAFASLRVTQRVMGAQNGWRKSQKIPGASVVDYILALAFIETLIFVLVTAILILAGLFFLGDQGYPQNIIYIAQSFLLLSLMGTGVGAFSLAIVRFFPMWELIFFGSQRGLIFLSGFFFVVDYVPVMLRDYVVYNPIAHGVMLLRLGYYGEKYPHMTMDTEYLFWWAIVSMFLGLLFERVTRNITTKKDVRELGAA